MQPNRCKRLLTWLLSSLLVTQLMGFADPGCVGMADSAQQNQHSATDNQLTVADMADSDHAHHQLGHGEWCSPEMTELRPDWSQPNLRGTAKRWRRSENE